MSIRLLRAGLSALVAALIPLSHTAAHEIVGNRFFPATLGIDDPGVNDELSLPTVDSFRTGDVPPVRQRDISAEFSKRITEDFAISFATTYTFLGPIDPTAAGANGFQNLETTFKYRVFKSPEHEFVMSVGLSVEWGGTGSSNSRRRSLQHLHADALFRQRARRSAGHAVMAQAGRDHRPGRLCDPGRNFTTTFGVDPDSGDSTADTEFYPACAELGRDHPIQHALSEVCRSRSRLAGFHQSPDPVWSKPVCRRRCRTP